jgi:hypothetical protein
MVGQGGSVGMFIINSMMLGWRSAGWRWFVICVEDSRDTAARMRRELLLL